MRSTQALLQHFKRQYFQYRHFDGYGRHETTRRFNEHVFSAMDRGGAYKDQFSQKNWDTAAAHWEIEWDVQGGGPSEDSLREMSELRLWYQGDQQNLEIRVITLHQPEPDHLRWRRLRGAQSARGIQVAADPGDRGIMDPSSAFQTSFPSHSHGGYHEASRHTNTTLHAISVTPSPSAWPSTWPQNIVSGPAGFIPSSLPFAFEPTRMEDTSTQMDTSLFEPSRTAGTSWQWGSNNNEGVQDWTWDQNEHDHC